MNSLPRQFKVMQFNLENFFLFLDLYTNQNLHNLTESEWQCLTSSTIANKPLAKVKAIAQAINDCNPDIVMLNEVGGIESLCNFNQHFLENRFEPHLVEGNSHRGIDVGYLVQRDLPVKALLISHRNRPIDFIYPHEALAPDGERKSHFFSRDVAELRLFRPGAHSPSLVLLLAHLKSKLDPDGIDPEGRARREAELKTLVKIYNDIRKELEGKTPIIIGGDFNGCASRNETEPEFITLHQETDLIDVFDAAYIPAENRYTQIQFPRSGGAKGLQLDYIFISPELKDKVVPEQTGVYMFKSDLQIPLPYVKTMDQRAAMPSDHYPIFVTFNEFLIS